ncbi:MAG TPA: hypothetical protein VIJ75_23555 [Hanamia sp.]
MTSESGTENKVKKIESGVYPIPKCAIRLLLAPALLKEVMQENNLSFLRPLKTVNVDGIALHKYVGFNKTVKTGHKQLFLQEKAPKDLTYLPTVIHCGPQQVMMVKFL